ncbi:MAG: hypothetical protein L6V85_05330 [Clostridiales bacterium]|nr:MAG: hypothetical protein L6V85_05330 [Clostridiales bacterium]
MLDVKNHSRLAPTDGKQSFCYKGDLKTLCDDINDRNNMQSVIVNDRIVIDVKKKPSSLTFSFVIYKDNDERVKVPKNHTRYVIDSMGCRLKSREATRIKRVFFPEHLLSSRIDSSKDIADVTYMCSLTIEELKEYYKQRGYKTEISDNVLSVTSLRTYPEIPNDRTLGVKNQISERKRNCNSSVLLKNMIFLIKKQAICNSGIFDSEVVKIDTIRLCNNFCNEFVTQM